MIKINSTQDVYITENNIKVDENNDIDIIIPTMFISFSGLAFQFFITLSIYTFVKPLLKKISD